MKQIIIIIIALTGVFSCKSTIIPFYNSEIISIDVYDLVNYWTVIPKRNRQSMERPRWLPRGSSKRIKGEFTFSVVIDSNGVIVERKLLTSIPEGWMTQKHLDHYPKDYYQPTKLNEKRKPVKFETFLKVCVVVARKREFGC